MKKEINHKSPFSCTKTVNESLFVHLNNSVLTSNNSSESKSSCSNKTNVEKTSNSFLKQDENFSVKVNTIYETFLKENKNFNNYLLFGQVQSGKTNFMLGLMLKFLEDKSNLFLFLSNSNNKLRMQTKERVLNLLYSLNDLKIRETFNDIYTYKISNLKTNKDNFINFSLKQKQNLDNIYELITEKLLHNQTIDRVIIFDDEGDVASFDNCKTENQTVINQKLEKIKNWLEEKQIKLVYFPVTATPYSHVIVDNNSFLRPQKVFVLKPGKNYFGLSEFYNYTEKYLNEEDDENQIIEIDEEDDNNEILENAIFSYLHQCVLYSLRVDNNTKPRMLINNERRMLEHFNIKCKIDKIIEKIKNKLSQDKRTYYLRFKQNFFNLSPWKLDNTTITTYSQFNNYLLNNILPKLDIRIVNSENKEENKSLELDKSQTEFFQIIIGSDQIQRGITIKDLTTCYLTRRAEKAFADTVFQMCRFFGYNKDIFPISRIYLSKQLKEDILNLNKINQYFINRFSQLENSDNDFSKLKQFVPSNNESLQPTKNTINNNITYLNFIIYEPFVYNNTFKHLNNDKSSLNAKYLWDQCKKTNNFVFQDSDTFFQFLNIEAKEDWFINTFYEHKTNFNKKLIQKFLESQLPIRIQPITNKISSETEFIDRKIESSPKENELVSFSWELSNVNYENEWVLDILPLRLWFKNEDVDDESIENFFEIYRLKLNIPYCLQDNKITNGFSVIND